MIETISTILSALTVLGGVGVLVLVVLFLLGGPAARTVSRHALGLSFLTALGALLGSLFYSEVANYAPCVLCWYQRIFIYPQVVLLGIALARRERGIFVYTLWLSAIGGIIALYHTAIQFGWMPSVICNAAGTVTCVQRFVMEFGYVTIPTMSLTVFALMFVLALYGRKTD